MKVVIAYDGSDCATAAVDDLRRSGMPHHADTLVISVGETALPPSHSLLATPSSAALLGWRFTSRGLDADAGARAGFACDR